MISYGVRNRSARQISENEKNFDKIQSAKPVRAVDVLKTAYMTYQTREYAQDADAVKSQMQGKRILPVQYNNMKG